MQIFGPPSNYYVIGINGRCVPKDRRCEKLLPRVITEIRIEEEGKNLSTGLKTKIIYGPLKKHISNSKQVKDIVNFFRKHHVK